MKKMIVKIISVILMVQPLYTLANCSNPDSNIYGTSSILYNSWAMECEYRPLYYIMDVDTLYSILLVESIITFIIWFLWFFLSFQKIFQK